jgi:hypothetical protein
MPEEKPFVGEYPNIVERNLSSKPEERESLIITENY